MNLQNETNSLPPEGRGTTRSRGTTRRRWVIKRERLTRNMVICAMFCALALGVEYLCFHIHVGGFLTFDLKDAVITLCAIVTGPFWAIPSAIVVCLLEFAIEPGTGPWGLLMNVVGSITFPLVAALIYSWRKTPIMAVLGLVAASCATTAVYLVMNLLITPLYSHVPTNVVAGMIPTLLLPFNVVKALGNSGLVMVLYKPVVTALRKSHLIEGSSSSATGLNARLYTIISVGLGVLIIAGAVLFMVFQLGGEIDIKVTDKPKGSTESTSAPADTDESAEQAVLYFPLVK